MYSSLGFNAPAMAADAATAERLRKHKEAMELRAESLQLALFLAEGGCASKRDVAIAYNDMGESLVGLDALDEAVSAFEEALSWLPKKKRKTKGRQNMTKARSECGLASVFLKQGDSVR